MKLQPHESGGRLIAGLFYFGAEEVGDKGLIQLLTTPGSIMRYGTGNTHIIDFPGEYDIKGNLIRCWEAGGMLGFVVRHKKNQFALLGNEAILDVASFDDGTHFLVTSEKIKEELEKVEIEGEVTVLGAEKPLPSAE